MSNNNSDRYIPTTVIDPSKTEASLRDKVRQAHKELAEAGERIKELEVENQKWKKLVDAFVINAERDKKDLFEAWQKITFLNNQIKELTAQ